MNENQRKAIETAKEKIKRSFDTIKNNDMVRFVSAEKKEISEVLSKRTPLMQEYYNMFAEQEKDPESYIGRMTEEMKAVVLKQEILSNAAEICENEADKKELQQMSQQLSNDPAVVNYKKYIKGLRYIAGIDEELDPEIKSFFDNELVTQIASGGTFKTYRTIEEPPVKTKEDRIAAEFRKKTAKSEAERMFGYTTKEGYSSIVNSLFKGWDKDEREKAMNGYLGTRETPVNVCVCALLEDGHKLEDILDPRKLLEEKQKMGELFKEKCLQKDFKWAAKHMYIGGHLLMRAVDQYAIDHKHDIKSKHDLARYANRLGVASHLCFDTAQEMKSVVDKAVGQDPDFLNKLGKTDKDISNFVDSAMQHRYGTLEFDKKYSKYEISDCKTYILAEDIVQQIQAERFYKELHKEIPDFENAVLTVENEADLSEQALVLPEVVETFGENEQVYPGTISEKQMSTLVSLSTGSFVKDSNIDVHVAKAPIKVEEEPEIASIANQYTKGRELNAVMVKDGVQLIKTDTPANPKVYLEKLEKKNLRGEFKNNSAEFNNLMSIYNMLKDEMKDKNYNDPDCQYAMQSLKEAASIYIIAKRNQKGYDSSSVSDESVNRKMLGLEGGKSIFTSRGRERYDFALKIVDFVSAVENEHKSVEKAENMEEKSNDTKEFDEFEF